MIPPLNKWGIDLGGTKIEGVIMDSSSPGESLSACVARPAQLKATSTFFHK